MSGSPPADAPVASPGAAGLALACELCGIPARQRAAGLAVDASADWTANTAIDASDGDRPWVVVQVRRHAERLDQTAGEQAQLPSVLAWLTAHLAGMPGVRRVNVQLLNETEPGHVHFHVSPTYEQERGAAGPGSFRLPAPAGARPPVRPAWLPSVPLPGVRARW